MEQVRAPSIPNHARLPRPVQLLAYHRNALNDNKHEEELGEPKEKGAH